MQVKSEIAGSVWTIDRAPGKLVQILVVEGQTAGEGQPLAVVE